MHIVINGDPREIAASNIAELVGALGLTEDRVAVEQNLEIVPRLRWATTAVCEGDRFEIVHFVGGG